LLSAETRPASRVRRSARGASPATVYRDAADITAKQTAQGSSWSLHEDVACAYAALISGEAGKPVMVNPTVRRDDVRLRGSDLWGEVVLPRAASGTWLADMSPGRLAKLAPAMDRMQAAVRGNAKGGVDGRRHARRTAG
jgi:hypothetical protein